MTDELGRCARWPYPHTEERGLCEDWKLLTPDDLLDDIREDLASKDEDIKWMNERIAEITHEIPRLERERLTCERDVAEAKLKRIALQAKLDAMEGK